MQPKMGERCVATLRPATAECSLFVREIKSPLSYTLILLPSRAVGEVKN